MATNLLIDIGARIATLQQDFAKAHTEISKFARDVDKEFKGISTAINLTGINQAIQLFETAGRVIESTLEKAKVGAEFKEQQGILNNLARAYQTTADKMLSSMTNASDGMIAKTDLLAVSLSGLAKGLNPDQMLGLADAAKILGDVVGRGPTVAFQELTEALETGRTKSLKGYLGTTLDLKTAFGDLDTKLTATEKAQAMYNTIMIQAAKLQAQQKDEVDSTSDKLDKATASYNNAKLAISEYWAVFVGGAYDAIVNAKKYLDMTDEQRVATMKQSGAIRTWTLDQDALNKKAKEIIDPLEEQNNKILAQVKARKDAEEAIKEEAKAAEEAARRDIKNASDLAESWKTYYDDKDKQAKNDAKAVEEYEKDKQKALNETTKAALTAADESIQAMKEEIAFGLRLGDEIRSRAKERGEAEREIYKDLRGYEDQYFAASAALIAAQAQKYKDLGVSEVAIAAWVAQETEKNAIKKALSENDFMNGVKAGYLEMQNSAMTFGKAGYEIFNTFQKSSATALSEGLFQTLKTGTLDAGALWTSFTDTMLRRFTDIMAQMVVEAATKNIVMSFGATWTDAARSILGTIARIAGGALEAWWGNSGTLGDSTEPIPGDARATGGPVSANQPYWVGEKGPELLFPGGPGYVMESNQSKAYAARNGGYIPGRELGGPVGTDDEGGAIYSFLGGDLHADLDKALMLVRAISIGERDNWTQYVRTSDPYNGGWTGTGHTRTYTTSGGGFFDSFLGQALLGPLTMPGDVISAINSGDYFKAFEEAADVTNTVNPSLEAFGKLIPDSVAPYVTSIGGIIGSIAGGPGFAALGAGIGSHLTGGDSEAAIKAAGIAAAMSWLSSQAEVGSGDFDPVTGQEIMVSPSAGYGTTFMDAIEKAGVNYAKKWMINQAVGALFPAENGGINFNYEGMGGGMNLMGLSDIAPRSDKFAFSAKDGLDYVPSDNFPIRAHKGEAVLTKGEAEQWRSGGGIVFNINGNLIADEQTFDDFVEKIDYALNRRSQREY